MDNIWTYRNEISTLDRDLVGYDVEATDGHIGKIDDAPATPTAITWSSTPGSGSSARSA